MTTTDTTNLPLFHRLIFALASLTLCGFITACSPSPDPRLAAIAANDQPYNTGWQFFRSNNALDFATAQQHQDWQNIQIPHTPAIEPFVVNKQFQGDAWYKKIITPEENWKGKHIALKFEAAMNVAEVWLNSEKMTTHLGGYLPFSIDLTEKLKWDAPNELIIRLDNRDNPITGPRPLKELDFNTYGGIYRSVQLQINNHLHITDAVAAGKKASGGIFVTYPHVDKEQAIIKIQTHVYNAHYDPKKFRVVQRLMDGEKVVADQTSPLLSITGKSDQENIIELPITQPRLWSPAHPNLYELVTRIYEDDSLVDEKSTRIGIREFKWIDGQLLLNGDKTFLRGINRHQEYPYVGYATSDAADYRDAVKIKSAGFDFVRLSHYPHSPAFMAAADELGLVVLDSILGWQYFSEDPTFQAHIQQTCRDLIRRDRNHASVIAWECSLNESQMTESFIDSLITIVHEEYPGSMSAGWQEYGYDIYLQSRQQYLEKNRTHHKPYIISEYGDQEYHKTQQNNATEPNEKRLLQQAYNAQEAHNNNLNTSAFADSYWVMFDYNHGSSPDLQSSGIMSIDRLPKYSYYFYQSQRDANEISDQFISGPMVFIASEWNENSALDIRVFSNADEVELILNGKIIGRQKPDKTVNTENLKHPPFTFTVEKFAAGELKAIGYIDDKAVAEHKVVTPGEAASLRLSLDSSGKRPQTGVKDIVFVYAQLTDSDGDPVRSNNVAITFSADGNATLISPPEVMTHSGIASALIEIGNAATGFKLTATTESLPAAILEVTR